MRLNDEITLPKVYIWLNCPTTTKINSNKKFKINIYFITQSRIIISIIVIIT